MITKMALLCLTAGSTFAAAQENRVVTENGVTYREVREQVKRPVAEVRIQERQETHYRQQIKSKTHDYQRIVHVPVTQYVVEQRVHGWWNPFRPTTISHHWVPRTHWEPRVETVQVPMQYAEWVPETRTVRQPVRTLRMETQEVTRRVAISSQLPRPSEAPSTPSWVARQPDFGGVSRMDSDPPRHSTRPSSLNGTMLR